MDQEFAISTGSRICNCILGIIIIFFGLVAFKVSDLAGGVQQLFYILPAAMLTGGTLILINQFKARIIVYYDSITKINVFTRTEMPISDIKGIRIGEKIITIESTSDSKITVRNYIEFGDITEFIAWLKATFTDLDNVDLNNEKETILHNTSLGFTEGIAKKNLLKPDK